jgi:hypothetical protein
VILDFNPNLAEITTSCTTAAMLLEAQQILADKCVEEVLKKVDTLTANAAMTPDKALACVHEIAAFRRIVYRQRQLAEAGRHALTRAQENR